MKKERILRYFEKLVTEGEIPHNFPGTPEFAIECLQRFRDGLISCDIWEDLCNGVIDEIPERIIPENTDHSHYFDCVDYIEGNGKWFFSGDFRNIG